ncbi:hypothetical protein Tco_0280506 [Tanacetum coccineum]
MLDALLVLIDEQVKIRFSNFRIALDKSQPDVIYKFWHTLHYDLPAKAYLFIIDDQTFEVNAGLLRKATAYDRPRLPMLQILWGMVTGSKRPSLWNANSNGDVNDDIKASDAYLEYLTKSSGTQPAKGKGKGLITKKDLEVALRNIRVPKKRCLETVFEELAQSEGVEADTVDSKETEEEDEIPLVRRQNGVVIGRQVHQESDEEALDHSKKLKGVERIGSGEGSGVTIEVPDELNQKGLNEGSDISSNDENNEAEDKEKAEAEKAKEEKGEDEQHMDDVGGNEQVGDAQAKVHEPKPHIKKPKATILSSSQTLSSTEYGNQLINNNPEVSLIDVLKEPEAEVQSLVDVSVLQQKPTKQRPPLVDTTMTLIPEKQHFHRNKHHKHNHKEAKPKFSSRNLRNLKHKSTLKF